MPNLKNYVLDSIISTTDNDHWRNMRVDFNEAFNINDKLEKLIPHIQDRAKKSVDILLFNNSNSININEFFLNEAQAQLQMALLGTSEEFQEKTNKKIRDVFYSKKIDYANTYYRELINEYSKCEIVNKLTNKGPLGNILFSRIPQTNTELFGNILIFSFAGHDTTGHTLTWLIYELCKNQTLQFDLHNEVLNFWKEKKINYL